MFKRGSRRDRFNLIENAVGTPEAVLEQLNRQ
jgi:hypothetical protein